MSDDIMQPPEKVIEAANDGRLVFFLGAGISKLMGFPLWRDLSIQLLDRAIKKGLTTYSIRQQIIENTQDNKMLASLVYSVYKEHDIWASELKTILGRSVEDCAGTRIVKKITESAFPIITTNYDHNVESGCSDYTSYLSCDQCFDVWKPSKPSVVHIHGSICQADTMIVTTTDYYNHYHKENTKVLLTKILGTNNVVVFLGYSLAEMELLEFILENNEGSFFFLNPYFSYKQQYIDRLTEYYKTINVTHLPYCIDEKGYEVLEDIVTAWMDSINRRSYIHVNHQNTILNALDDGPASDSVKDIVDLISVNSESEQFFYKSILSREDSVDWLVTMEDHSLLTAETLYDGAINGSSSASLVIQILSSQNINDVRLSELKEKLTALLPDDIDFTNNSIVRLNLVCLIFYLNTGYDDRKGRLILKNLASTNLFFSCCVKSVEKVLKGNRYNSETIRYTIQYLIETGIEDNRYEDYKDLVKIFDSIPDNLVDSIFGDYSFYLKNKCDIELELCNLGSVSEYMSEYTSNETISEGVLLVAIFEKLISRVSKTTLYNFIRDNLTSGDPLKTLVFHVINEQFLEMPDLLWELPDFSDVRYAELYDFVEVYAKTMSNEDLIRLSSLINKTFEGDDGRSKVYRYDLYSAFPENYPKRAELLSLNHEPNHDDYTPIKHRGKKAWLTFGWESPEFTDYYSFKSSINTEEDDSIRRMQYDFIRSNPSVVYNHLEELYGLVDSRIDLRQSICSSICKSDNPLNPRFKEFLIQTLKMSADDRETFYGCIFYLNDRLDSDEILKNEVLEIFERFLKDNLEAYLNSGCPASVNLVINNWYLSILAFLVNSGDGKGQKIFMDYIDALTSVDCQASKAAYILAGLECWHLKSVDQVWYNNMVQRLFTNDHVSEISQVMSYIPSQGAVEYVELICSSDLIPDFCGLQNSRAPFILGTWLSFSIFKNDGNTDLLSSVSTKINDKVVNGVLFAFHKNHELVLKNVNNFVEVVNRVISILFPNRICRSNVDYRIIVNICQDYPESNAQELLENSVIFPQFISSGLTGYLRDNVQCSPTHVGKVLLKLSKSESFVLPRDLEEIITELSKSDKSTAIEICNNFINRGLVDFGAILEKTR